MPLLRRSLLAALATLAVVPAARAVAPAARAGFKPPGNAARRAAIGPLDGLPPELRRAFELGDEVPALPRPGPCGTAGGRGRASGRAGSPS